VQTAGLVGACRALWAGVAQVTLSDQPNLNAGKVGPFHRAVAEFPQELIQGPFIRHLNQNLRGEIRIEAPVARWFHTVRNCHISDDLSTPGRDCFLYVQIFNPSMHKKVMMQFSKNKSLTFYFWRWHSSCQIAHQRINNIMKILNSTYRPPVSFGRFGVPIALAALLLSACNKKMEPAPVVRAVRSIVVEKREIGDPILLTGHLRARDEVSLAFRLSGKLIERTLDVGDKIKAGQTVARLDDQIERNGRNAAQANLVAMQAVVEQSEASEKRMRDLLPKNAVSHDAYEVVLRQLKTARAQVDAAQANLKSADDQLGYTELKAEADGVITKKGAEPGEVVQVGRMILTEAQDGGRDAVFDMPAQLIRDGLSSRQEVELWLADNQNITATGKIREISPQADPVTRNYQVKVEVVDPPAGMFLGATVVGRLKLQVAPLIEIPSSALTMLENKPAAWVIDAKDSCVHRREIKIARYTPGSVIVTDGLQAGERVVTAGVQELHESQEVKLLGESL
jgi:RND family efflux transporter MFP subunit